MQVSICKRRFSRPIHKVATCSLVVLGAHTWANVALGDSSELGQARLSVERGIGAEACPDAQRVADHVRAADAEVSAGAEPIVIDVQIRRENGDFGAEITVSGPRRGVRHLRARGPGCEGLERQLTVVLTVLLDRSPSADERDPAARREGAPPSDRAMTASEARPDGNEGASRASSPASPIPALERDQRGTREPPWMFGYGWLGGGINLQVAADPVAWGSLELGVERGRWGLLLGAFSTLDASEELAPGSIDVRWTGAFVRACFAITETTSVRASLCGAGAAAALRGKARDFARIEPAQYRPWFAAGAGADVRVALGKGVYGAFAATTLAPLVRETFSIDDGGQVFRTRALGLWMQLSVGARIW
jgi:hypothetical protein